MKQSAWRELLAMQCGWCDQPANTRIYLRGAMPSDDDLWCCAGHQLDALGTADEFKAWRGRCEGRGRNAERPASLC